MDFLTDEQKVKLLHNGHEDHTDQDHAPVVKLYFPGTSCVWLLSEMIAHNMVQDIAFGLCDLGMGCPELGYVSLAELASINLHDLTVQRDDSFVAQYPMSVYAEAARNCQEITEDPKALEQANAALIARKRKPS